MRAGFAACHVQLQAHVLELFVLGFQCGFFSGECVAIHCKIISHNMLPLKKYVLSLFPAAAAPLYLGTIAGVHYIIYDFSEINKRFLP